MIGWIIDRLWARKNRAALDQVDQQIAALDIMKARTDKRMEEAFGPDWRAEGERRLAKHIMGKWTVS